MKTGLHNAQGEHQKCNQMDITAMPSATLPDWYSFVKNFDTGHRVPRVVKLL